MHETITVLTIDLAPQLAERLRLAQQERPGTTLRDIALEALEEWLQRREPSIGAEAGSAGVPPACL